ncbi:MAG: ABC-F family ATP-binding cassette domain-containing protein [Pseudobdellovibrionaceae bacterium]|nr:ABC-F family ATP-binding cassette domain-containing protein [Bdellovibrionales bacterium]USN47886.1 MAG: ABC-F family ATP-binding cassette domain-containing protein [Pseudobdellovibrionaceae bacterium]
MSILLQLQNASKRFGARELFHSVNFAINSEEHIGVIGPNGAGKSTLFQCLIHPDALDDGKAIYRRNLRIGHLAQEDAAPPALTGLEFIQQNTEYPDWEIIKLGAQFGLLEDHFHQQLKKLSGGFRMRIKLLNLLCQDSELLLLDEPTNYLDLESTLVLEKFLQQFPGSFLLISHDREFLRRTTDHTLEVEKGDITKFNGNIDDYFEQKALLAEQLQKMALSQEAKRQQVMAFADRFRAKATKAKQVQSRLRQLAKMQSVEIKSLPVRTKISIPPPLPIGKLAIDMEQADLGYPGVTVLKSLHFSIFRGDHIGVVGANGAGKTTLLKALAGELKPISGRISHGQKVEVGYYAQHVAEALDPVDTVYESLAHAAHTSITPQEIKDLAGSLLFSGDSINKKIAVLSGGEKSRVAIGQVLLSKSPVIILDEPTNHLDFHTVEALTQALRDFAGTLIVVSHDRSFIGRVAKKIFDIKKGTLELFPGTYDEYVWSVQRGQWGAEAEDSTVPKPAEPAPGPDKSSAADASPLNKKQSRQWRAQLLGIEKSMEAINQKIDELSEQLTQTAGASAQGLARDLHLQRQNLEQLESQWLELSEKISE